DGAVGATEGQEWSHLLRLLELSILRAHRGAMPGVPRRAEGAQRTDRSVPGMRGDSTRLPELRRRVG
ncbi:MAG: hypothetical protein OXH09_08825, partial [Gammaproteobacteria bacterium]|nr:hypothetical protein [Gammaproteobacteria bacterium]